MLSKICWKTYISLSYSTWYCICNMCGESIYAWSQIISYECHLYILRASQGRVFYKLNKEACRLNAILMQTGQVLWMYCTFLGGNLVAWRSKKQSAEAEVRALVHDVCELLWLQILLTELRLFKNGPLMLYRDNKAAIDIANNPVHHDRTKHIEIDRHSIKEKLDEGVICLPM